MNSKRYLKNALAMLLCIGGLCGAGVYAADAPSIEPQARVVIDNSAARYEAARSYSDVTTLNSVARTLKDSGDEQLPAAKIDEWAFKAEVEWERPNKARIVKYAADGVSRAVSDGKTLWAITPRHKGYYVKRPADFNSIQDAMNESGVGAPGLGYIVEGRGVDWMEKEGLTSLKMGTGSTVDNIPVRLVVGHFEIDSGGNSVITFAIGTKDGLLRRVIYEYANDKGTLTLVETHTNIRLNAALPDSTFAFIPPHGAKPINYFSTLEPDRFKPSVKVGEALPPFQATDLNEKTVSLDDYKGKVLIIHFFATRQATAEVPEMVRLFNRYKDEGLAIVGVAMDGRRERVTNLISKDDVPYPIVFDGKVWDNAVAKLYGVHAWPTILLVGRDGTLRLIGDYRWEFGFEEAVTAALADKKAKGGFKWPHSN